MKFSVNMPCPCGSGKKYKRCCLTNPLPLLNPRADIKPFVIKRYFNLLALCEQLLGIANKMLDREYKAHEDKVLLGTFYLGKAFKTSKASLHLCRLGYGEDAAILIRTLLDMAVNYIYLLKDKTGKRIIRYFEYDWYQRGSMYKKYGATKDEIVYEIKRRELNPGPHAATLEDILHQYDRVKKEYGFTDKGWSDKNLADMAREVGMLELYKSVFKLQSNFSHTSPRAINDYIKYEDEVYIVQTGPSYNWIEQNLISCFDFFHQILTAFNGSVEAGFKKEIDTIVKDYLNEVNIVNNSKNT